MYWLVLSFVIRLIYQNAGNSSGQILFCSILNVSVPLFFLASKDMSVLSDLFAAAGLGRAGVVPAGLSFSTGGVSDIWWGIVMTIVSAMSSMMSCAGVPVRRSHGDRWLFIFICLVMEEMTIDINNYVVLEYWYMWFEFYDAKLGQKWNDVLYMPDRYAYGFYFEEICACVLSREQVMTSLTKCMALKERVGDWEWADMMALYCRNAAEEDSEFARRVGVLLEEMEAAYKERVDFIKELEVVPGVDAAVKTAEFLNDVLWKDERRMQRLCKLRMDAYLMAYDQEKFAEKR
ncbi:hypothetical protein Tco_0860857 [Tanacetum coccineum]|uniref:Uncharacterized protein n=1 Tax=Tanacetum coccineum TaxID=301880 RepID=A0ABQ5BG63_9ASTR